MTRLALLAAFSLTACFGSHGTDDDSFPPVDDIAPRDAGAPSDGSTGRPDLMLPEHDGGTPVPPSCSLRRGDVSCGTVPATSGVRFTLPLSIGGPDECYCGENVECQVAATLGPDGTPERIELTTYLCHGGALCDACFPYIEGECAMPALPGGRYPVTINGDPAFELDVEEADFIGDRACTTVAEGDALGCGPVSWPPSSFEVGEVCHPESVLAGARSTITVVDTCATCGQQPGPCEVRIDETGIQPILAVTATSTFTSCDIDCPSICMRMEHECVVPATVTRATSYGVVVNGTDFGTRIEVGDHSPAEVCAGRVGTFP